MPDRWRIVLAAALVLMALRASVANEPPSRRPNIVFIVADDLGYGEPGCYGGKEIPTPNIDKLAASGMRFTSGYVTAPFCAASRAALMTGVYQTRYGFEFNPIGAVNAQQGIGLPAVQRTIAERLREVGYATSLVGKWHLGGTAPYHPMRRGFDEFFGFLHEGHFYVPQPWDGVTTWLRRKSLPDGSQGRWASPDGHVIWSTHLAQNEPDYDADNPLLRSSQPVDEKSYLTDAFTRESISFIERHRSQPFFLYLAYNAVHSPLQATEADLARFAHIPDIQRRIFAAMLAHLDDSIGQVLAKLQQLDLTQNTLIVFLSDNGGATKELTSSNAPLRGGKGDLWEGGIRIPMIISWNGHVPPGKVSDVPITSMDTTATALAAGNAMSPTAKLDGKSLLPIFEGSTDAIHEGIYWRVGSLHAMRLGNYKMVTIGHKTELFNLQNDISESRDISASEQAQLDRLQSMWKAWNAEQVPPLWK